MGKSLVKTFGPGLDYEFLIETSYKFQLSKNFSVTPDVQLVLNPAGNPSESSIWIFWHPGDSYALWIAEFNRG